MDKEDILNLIREDEWMMKVLKAAQSLNLPDWMIGAGFVRNKVWDRLHGYEKKEVDTEDIDLIYYDSEGNDYEADKELSEELKNRTDMNWEIINQAYAHKWNNFPPHESCKDALSHWVETATCIAVKLEDGELKLIAPHGIDDLVNLIVRPSPYFFDKLDVFRNRVEKKNWLERWPDLEVVVERK